MKRTKDFARLFISISMLVLIFFLAAAFSIKDNSTPALHSRSMQIAPSGGFSITHPPDISFYHGTTGNNVSWTVTESGAPSRTYTVIANVSYLDIGKNWTSGIPVQENLDGLLTGIYNVSIVASDGLGNKMQDTVIVTIMNPLLITHHGDFIVPFNSTGYHYIYWDLTDVDNSSATYDHIYFNGGLISMGGWVNKTTFIQMVGLTPTTYVVPTPIGSYNYTMESTNSISDRSLDTVIVTVVNPLTVTHPSDIDYYHGNTGNFINWTLTFADWLAIQASYVVYQNGTSVASGNWQSFSHNVNYSVDGLLIGSYNFTIVARDPYGDAIDDTVIVTVAHLLAVTHPGDFSNPRGNGGFNFDWYITGADKFTPHYTIYKNGTVYASGTWFDGNFMYVYPSMLLPIGSYNFTIVVTDGIGGMLRDTVNVTIVNPLTITHPADISSLHPITGQIQWYMTNVNGMPTKYNIAQNGTLVDNGIWTYSHTVTHNIGGLLPGWYNFTIVALDTYNDTISDMVIVNVWNPLNITHPADIICLYGNSTKIQWHLTNVRSNNTWFKVYQNGTLLDNGTWILSYFVNETTSGLAVGSYNFTIVAWDINNATISDMVILTVYKPSPSPGISFDTTTFIVVTMIFVPIFALTTSRRKMTKKSSK
ncbi:MAG TPA: hypothetical protein VKM55_15400 [Candidatus Lokiarchaeia archaeon]|nr:hypothetical protein [Candidatus Lokiarchaeia archaeon]